MLSWTTLILAFTFYILTTLYAWHPELVSRHSLFGGTPAKALRVLAILSSTANFFLSASISQATDLIHGMLIARHAGLDLLSALALHPRTGLLGHAEIMFRWDYGRLQTRVWSALKAVSMAIIPILGIVIMRDVEAIPIFYQNASVSVSRGYGVGAFDSSLAPLLQPMADAVFGTRFKDFISDPHLVSDVSTDADRKACSNTHGNNSEIICHTKYFIPGGIEQLDPTFLVDKDILGDRDIQHILAKNQYGYFFEFQENESVVFNQQADCARYGYALGAYQLCLRDVGLQQIAASLTLCPKSLAGNLSCLNNATWPLEGGWGTILSTYSRPADVVYNGLNGTIMSHKFPNTTLTPVNINAPQLLQVFNILFNPSNPNTTYGSILAQLGIISNRPTEPLTIWQYFQGLAKINDRRAKRRAMIGLQSLLAIPIYYCQAKELIDLRRLLLEQIDNSVLYRTLRVDIANLFHVVEPDTDIYPALMRFTLRIGHSSLLAYIVLAGCALSVCIIATVMAWLRGWGRLRRYTLRS